MKAIILAAGLGSRLGRYTEELPKCLLRISGKTILEIQIENYRKVGITDISIVKGYRGEKIDIDGVKCYWNRDYESTNMVVSFMKAASEFDDDIIVSYADILFDSDLLVQAMGFSEDIAILADSNWEKYWLMRYGTTDFDLESLILDERDCVVEIGRPVLSKEAVHARYVGILRFPKQCIQEVAELARRASETYRDTPWKLSGAPYPKAHMTDLLQALIDSGIEVKVRKVANGWLEFDTASDYENALLWISDGRIKTLFKDYNALINKECRRKTQ